ncbi:uncharacterized protein BDZ99DRAFT_577619 [Mytilinidion resinicola]|uniref:F-box domain-containing protein n=1 Tax=Mytilinidion resinicola TaxID=574789 RepID=A0A6A6Y0F5_9PEZI|nr:uncharacterized protein BDZ99DRAFT_577619 [Mytilinidion resinicola]KAF2801494.1 hypothetical protein BDZ99DRAFT_577619 [Mytilinidion resinicola]
MRGQNRTLDTLPVELIQRVAGLLPCSSALNLICVNHKLREVCNDRHVFKHIAQTLHFDSSYSGELHHRISQKSYLDHFTRKWDSDAFFRGKSLLETKEVALAVEKAHGWLTKPTKPNNDPNYDHVTDEDREICRWLPQLIALHHPSALHADPSVIWNFIAVYLAGIYQTRYDDLAFSFLAALLEQLVPLGAENLGQMTCHEEAVVRAMKEFTDVAVRGDFGSGHAIVDTMNHYSYGLSPVIMVRVIARLAPKAKPKTKPKRESMYPVKLPLPSKIPFQSFFKSIPRVLQDRQTTDGPFPHFDAGAMLTSGFMCSGEWVGYHSWNINDYKIDIPMQSIYFEEHRNHDGDTLLRSTSGYDTYGRFELLGTLTQHFKPQYAPSEGHTAGRAMLQMTKSYQAPSTEPYKSVPAQPFQWGGWVTPFGIVGTWGHPRPNLCMGDFWLWKREWCYEPESAFDQLIYTKS